MKIMTLNTWGGRAGGEQLLAFFEKYKDDVDVFCLQEIWSAPYDNLEGSEAGGLAIEHTNIMTEGLQQISRILEDFTAYFHPHHLENYGLLMMVRKGFDVEMVGDIFVHKERGFIPEGDVGLHARNIQYVTFQFNNETFNILNFHGLWNGQGKGDSPDRLNQSKNAIDFMSTLKGHIVFCGDFNLRIDTKSIKMIEDFGMRNLICDYNITSTRTSFYEKPEKHADYIFVNKDMFVSKFEVLAEEVSDHAALLLEINI